ncbi:MAG: aminotransferase class IV [Candidatus Krumholzibacteriia bacterium]
MAAGSHVILNGELLPRGEARLGVDDLGFLVGDGVFETLRLYGGVPFLLEEHIARLFASLRLIGLEVPWTRDQLLAQVRLLVEHNALQFGSGRLRITVTRGPGAPPASPRGGPTLLVTADPYEPPDALVYERGVHVETSRDARHPTRWHRVKSTSHQANLLLRRQASSERVFEVLQWNDQGHLAEGSSTNVFMVDADGVLRTPHPREGCLKGVTRNAVLTIVGQSDIRHHEGEVTRELFAGAREIFLTSSLVELVPVRRLDGNSVGETCPGSLTLVLRAAYQSFVRSVVGGRGPGDPEIA